MDKSLNNTYVQLLVIKFQNSNTKLLLKLISFTFFLLNNIGLIVVAFGKTFKRLLWSLFMDRVQLPESSRTNRKKQFTFNNLKVITNDAQTMILMSGKQNHLPNNTPEILIHGRI